MSGVVWAAVAGVSFGVFQAVNRRANTHLDAFRATFWLLVISVLALGAVSAITQDLGSALRAPISSYGWFAAAGGVHYFFGWTMFSASQKQIGAASTGVVLAATPLIATILASVFLDQSLSGSTIGGVVLVTFGVTLVVVRMGEGPSFKSVPWTGLGASLAWGTSPLLIRWGLDGLDSPLIGVTVSLAVAATLYGIVFALGLAGRGGSVPAEARPWLVAAGLLVAFAMVAQWTAYSLVDVAIVVTLVQLATPVVVFLAPLVVGTHIEKPTPALIAGMLTVLAGSTLVIWQV